MLMDVLDAAVLPLSGGADSFCTFAFEIEHLSCQLLTQRQGRIKRSDMTFSSTHLLRHTSNLVLTQLDNIIRP